MRTKPTVESLESIGGIALFGVPLFDAAVWILDNYARVELLMNLQSQLPSFLFNPVVIVLCLLAGLYLIQKSYERQVRRAVTENRALVDQHGEEYRPSIKAKWLTPLLVCTVVAITAAPALAIRYTLMYEGFPPNKPKEPLPPSLLAYSKSPQLIHMPQRPTISQQSSGRGSPNTAIIGNQNQVTIGSLPVPPRRLSEQQVAELKAAAFAHPFSFAIVYILNDQEAFKLAEQIGETLTAAGWKLKKPITGATFLPSGGGPLFGMELMWKGDTIPPGAHSYVDPRTPVGALAVELFKAFPEDFHGGPSPVVDADSIELDIYANPKSKP